jgi:hypothetical protein
MNHVHGFLSLPPDIHPDLALWVRIAKKGAAAQYQLTYLKVLQDQFDKADVRVRTLGTMPADVRMRTAAAAALQREKRRRAELPPRWDVEARRVRTEGYAAMIKYETYLEQIVSAMVPDTASGDGDSCRVPAAVAVRLQLVVGWQKQHTWDLAHDRVM